MWYVYVFVENKNFLSPSRVSHIQSKRTEVKTSIHDWWWRWWNAVSVAAPPAADGCLFRFPSIIVSNIARLCALAIVSLAILSSWHQHCELLRVETIVRDAFGEKIHFNINSHMCAHLLRVHICCFAWKVLGVVLYSWVGCGMKYRFLNVQIT